jgi:hypothetical protein
LRGDASNLHHGIINSSTGGGVSSSSSNVINSGVNNSSFYSSAAANIGIFGGSSIVIDNVPHSPTPPLQRRLAKSFSVAPSSGSQLKGFYLPLFKHYFLLMLLVLFVSLNNYFGYARFLL